LVLMACQPGEPEVETIVVTTPVDHTNTITNTITNNNTITNSVAVQNTVDGQNTVYVPTGELQPGHFDEVLIELQRLQDNGTGASVGANGAGENHQHLSEIIYREALPDTNSQMLYCSYTFGVLNADSPGNLSFQAQGFTHLKTTGSKNPGCIHLMPDETDRNIIFTTHHGGLTDGLGFLSGWDLNMVNDATDLDLNGIPDFPTKISSMAPTEIPKLSENSVDVDGDGTLDVATAYEGLDVEGGLIWVTLHDEGLAAYTFDYVAQTFTRVMSYTNLENGWDIRVDGDQAWVADGVGGLVSLDVTDPMNPVEQDRLVLDGLARDITRKDDILYIACESGGVAVVDVSDPSNLVLVEMLAIEGGSAIQLQAEGDLLYLAAWNDARVYDISTATDPTFIGAARHTVWKEYDSTSEEDADRPDITDRTLAIDGHGNYIFDGTWWVSNQFQLIPDRVAPYLVLPENVAQLNFPGDVNLGDTSTIEVVVRNDGTADLTVYDLWSDDPAFTAQETEFLIPPGGSATLHLDFNPTIGADQGPTVTDTANPFSAEESTIFHVVSDDPQQPIREIYLVGNADGIGPGDPFPETTATLMDDSDWSFTADALGSVTLVIYFATF
jgi:hypothetical protein